MLELKPITEYKFIDTFDPKLAAGQEKFVSHPILSLAQAYVNRNQCQRSASARAGRRSATSW